MKLKTDNRGASLVMVIGVISMVTILVTIALAIGLFNYQMKVTNRGSKDNFYSAEQVLDEIRLGLQKDVSDAMTTAYYQTMDKYAGEEIDKATDYFNELYTDALRKSVSTPQNKSYYDIDHLLSFLDENVKKNTTLTTADGKKPFLNVNKKNGIVLKNLSLTYVNEEDYVTSIRTDIQLLIPDINLSKFSSGSSVVQYALVAQEGITAQKGIEPVTFDGNVYAGTGTASQNIGKPSVSIENSVTLNVTERKNFVVKDTINVGAGGRLNLEKKATLWANDIEAKSASKLQLLGTSYVANDLTLMGGADVTIGGEYYGFGNPKAALQADSIKELQLADEIEKTPSDYSSAIIVNGLGAGSKARLNLKDTASLMLAGNAYIGDSRVLMGESLTIKSNQIAYLVPESCMMGASNPMTAAVRNEQLGIADSDTADQRTEKETAYRNQLLMQAQSNVSAEVKEIVQMLSKDGLYYYYMQFSSAKAADQYFSTYYQSAASGKIKDYLQYYVENQEVRINADAKRETNGNILVYDETGISAVGDTIAEGMTDVSENKKTMNQLVSYQDMFRALNTNLSMDYSALTMEQKLRETVFGNLLDDTYHLWVIGGGAVYSYREGEETYIAKMYLNGGGKIKDRLSSIRKSNHDGTIKILFTDRDLIIDEDFDGLIITKGRAYIQPGVKLTSDSVLVAKLIENATTSMNTEQNVQLKNVMYNPDEYMGKFLKADSRSDNYIRLEDLVVYANWSKQ